jgi:hypothetical protein
MEYLKRRIAFVEKQEKRWLPWRQIKVEVMD